MGWQEQVLHLTAAWSGFADGCLGLLLTVWLFQKHFADILSVMATTNEGSRDCLKYRLLGTGTGLDQWGHEYVR
jgi:hypothetical protein